MQSFPSSCSRLFDHCQDAVIVANQHHQIIYGNDQAKALFGDDFSPLWNPRSALLGDFITVIKSAQLQHLTCP
ncbi:MAG: PAS domain-containing protein [Leptolyngbya sp. RL_3_1]|nr:PAS domain-containing protein [Leptolyngbya sp. RL_3_1]